MLINWDQIYNYVGIRDFIYFISSPAIQDAVFPVKLVFIFFTAFFFCAVIWFYVNSSYIQYKFLQDTMEFFSKESYGLKKISNDLKKIKKRAESGSVPDLKLAIIEMDDFLYQKLQDLDYEGDTFEQIAQAASTRVLPNVEEVIDAHVVRNAIVYEPDFVLDPERGKQILSLYETAIKNVASR